MTCQSEKRPSLFGVPKSTLMDRLHGRISLDVVKSGPLPLFSDEQEALLTGHLKTMAEVGYVRRLSTWHQIMQFFLA